LTDIPQLLEDLLRQLDELDQQERGAFLTELADDLAPVPPGVASKPYPEDHRVPKCESEAFVWATDRPDGTLDFHFAVENPHGISAKAVSAALAETLSGQPLDEVASVSPDIVNRMFGRQLSMGKGEGLSGIVEMATYFARRRLKQRAAT
jgi:cysteine desulfuration protein SufE